MTVDALRSWHRAEPFWPFVMRTATGDSLAVPRPGAIALCAESGEFVVVDGHRRFQPTRIAQITEVAPLPSPPARVADGEPDLFA